MEKKKILAIVGPTASGKTALSIALAKKLDGEVVSFDSMQVYRGMDIGTAKPTIAERDGVPHHMFDVVMPSEAFSCADYTPLARKCIADIHARGKLPILVGGTGLYLESVLYQNEFADKTTDAELRAALSTRSPDDLWAELSAVDPVAASAIHKNNVRRVIRALEIYKLTGLTKTELDAQSRQKESLYDSTLIGIDFADRAVLEERMAIRVDAMLADGLVAEVSALRGYLSETAGQAIGYKELLAYLDGKETLDSATATIKLRTRQYAKRQRTWFAHMQNVQWWLRRDGDIFEDIVNFAIKVFHS